MKRTRLFALAILVSIGYLLSGCSTLPNGRGWGEDATFKPGWQVVRESAVNAARSPYTWVPLAGAALLQIGSPGVRVKCQSGEPGLELFMQLVCTRQGSWVPGNLLN